MIEYPYFSILVVAIVASCIGIAVEYLVNRDFVSGGFWVTFIFILGQWAIVRKRITENRKKEKSGK